LLVRRNRRTRELAFYRCYSATPVPLSTLVRAAGRRWTVEETFEASKGLAGLDEHQFRRWTSWHRSVTLAMLAHAFLAVTAAVERRDHPASEDLIPLSGNEIQHLFAALINPVHDLAHRLRWSRWRRRHQARARARTTDDKQPLKRDLPQSHELRARRYGNGVIASGQPVPSVAAWCSRPLAPVKVG
jgi:hypothetical protein